MLNKYHRYLNLPFEIRKPQICNVKPKDLKHYDIPYHKDENIEKLANQLGLIIVNTELFYTPGVKNYLYTLMIGNKMIMLKLMFHGVLLKEQQDGGMPPISLKKKNIIVTIIA